MKGEAQSWSEAQKAQETNCTTDRSSLKERGLDFYDHQTDWLGQRWGAGQGNARQPIAFPWRRSGASIVSQYSYQLGRILQPSKRDVGGALIRSTTVFLILSLL